MRRDAWRNSEGFGRSIEVEPRVWSCVGADGEDHAIGCEFIVHQGILPCSCDATRRRFGVDHEGRRTKWFDRWLRWEDARSHLYHEERPIKWPVTGPDGDAWIPGIDFNDAKLE